MTAFSNDEAATDPATGLRVEVAVADGVGQVQAIGELDQASAPVLAPALEILAAAGAAITVDLSRLTFCDSQGINLFFRIARAARESGGSLTLANPSPILLRLFDVVGPDASVRVIAASPPVASAMSGSRDAANECGPSARQALRITSLRRRRLSFPYRMARCCRGSS